MRRVLLAAAVSVACALGALPASGAPRPHIVDPRGDWPAAGQDIVSATFSTIGKGKTAALQIRMELAGPPTPDAALYWEVGWSTPDCALSYIEYTRSAYSPGFEHAELITRCRPGGPIASGGKATGRLEGSTLVLTTPLAQRYPVGTLLSDPFAGSWTFLLVAGAAPVFVPADSTDKGRPYRVGS